jgi:hypothetical protein
MEQFAWLNSFNAENVKAVLAGTLKSVSPCFTWSLTEQGGMFWREVDLALGEGKKLSKEARKHLALMLNVYRKISTDKKRGKFLVTINRSACLAAANGDGHMLDGAFSWSSSDEGDEYWRRRYGKPPSDETVSKLVGYVAESDALKKELSRASAHA